MPRATIESNEDVFLSAVAAMTDVRQQQLEQWLASQLGQPLCGVSAGSDAGFRRYFRYDLADRSLIAMDAPPAQEDCRPFVKVAGLLADAGVSVPHIIAQDVEQGFLLLSDLGQYTYLDVMTALDCDIGAADALFTEAIAALIKIQQASRPGILPDYDQALLRRELELFPEWYLQQHLGMEMTDVLRALLDKLFEQLITQVLSQPKSYVHRDFMPRNLMPGPLTPSADRPQGGIGVLDFQDAVYGPVSYDAACLFKDAFISWPEPQVELWLQQYWRQALQAGVELPAQFGVFQRDCDFMGVHRHLKVLGIFARICHRDGKGRYIKDAPRFITYLQVVADRRPELSALAQLLSLLEGYSSC